MTKLKIVKFPSPILRAVSNAIPAEYRTKFTDAAKAMKEFVEATGHYGLSAPQIGLSARLIVVRVNGVATVAYNPVIVEASKSRTINHEGCLSFERRFNWPVPRHNSVAVEWEDEHGNKASREFNGLESFVWQHEIDHLNGKLISDY